MSIIYQETFDGQTVGGALTGWTNISGTWLIGNTNPITGDKTFGSSAFADAHAAIFSSMTPVTNVAVQISQVAVMDGPITGTPNGQATGIIVRDDGTGANHYVAIPLLQNTGGHGSIVIFKKVSGSYNFIGSPSRIDIPANYFNGADLQAGQAFNLRVEISGNTLSVWMWLITDTMPVAAMGSYGLDNTFNSAGVIGLYEGRTGGGVAGNIGVDNLYIGAPGDTFTKKIAPNATGINYWGRWNVQSTLATTINCGGKIELTFTGPGATLLFDTTGISSYPDIEYQVDGGLIHRVSLTSTKNFIPVILPFPTYSTAAASHSFVNSTTHRIKIWAAGIDESAPSQWTALSGAVKFAGLMVDTASTILSASSLMDTIEFVGDSITASVRLLYTGGASDQTVMDPTINFPEIVCELLGCQPIVCGFGRQGLTITGNGGVPVANTAFPFIYSGVAWNPTVKPKVLVNLLETNDALFGVDTTTFQTAYQTFLSTLRSQYPTTIIINVAMPNINDMHFGYSAAISAATSAAGNGFYFADASTGVLSAAAGVDYSDNFAHWNPGGAVKFANWLASQIKTVINAVSPPSSSSFSGHGGGQPIFSQVRRRF
jgi:lysophospholipase L1-like esterase